MILLGCINLLTALLYQRRVGGEDETPNTLGSRVFGVLSSLPGVKITAWLSLTPGPGAPGVASIIHIYIDKHTCVGDCAYVLWRVLYVIMLCRFGPDFLWNI